MTALILFHYFTMLLLVVDVSALVAVLALRAELGAMEKHFTNQTP